MQRPPWVEPGFRLEPEFEPHVPADYQPPRRAARRPTRGRLPQPTPQEEAMTGDTRKRRALDDAAIRAAYEEVEAAYAAVNTANEKLGLAIIRLFTELAQGEATKEDEDE